MQKIIEKEANVNTKEIEALKKSFPSCFDKNGNFNIEKFQNIISNGTNIVKESYKLDWLGKSYSRLLANTPVTTLLTEDIEHNSKPENKNSNNLYIEGDNLEVLKHLTNAYSEKVKMIYIDPPYNTGSDFIYQDDRKFTPEELSKMANIDEEEAKRVLDFTNSKSNSHSAWLTFMYPRLYIARELLKEDGVIFISIDDNEQAQLKLLCDEIFGFENTETYIWDLEDKSEGSFTKTPSNTVRNMHEYIIVCYKKNVSLGTFKEQRYLNNEFKNVDNDPRGPWMSANISRNGITSTAGTKYFTITSPTGTQYTRNWTLTKEEFEKLNDNNEIYFASDGEGVPRLKLFKNTKFNSVQSSVFKNLKTSKFGKKIIKDLFDNEVFPFSKPITLIERFLEISDTEEQVILDFFSGSATTAHAVMQLNAEDNGNRKYIMVQLPEVIDSKTSKSAYDFCTENNFEPIIPSIGKERIKRASKKIIEENQDKDYIKDLDFGFKVFKTKELENSNYLDELESFDPTREKLFSDDVLTVEELYSLALTWKTHDGIPLTTPFNRISLSSYEGLIVENRLYLMYANFTTEALQELLRYNDEEPEFLINQVIVYGLNFNSKHIKEIKEAIMMNNKKSASIELDVRY